MLRIVNDAAYGTETVAKLGERQIRQLRIGRRFSQKSHSPKKDQSRAFEPRWGLISGGKMAARQAAAETNRGGGESGRWNAGSLGFANSMAT